MRPALNLLGKLLFALKIDSLNLLLVKIIRRESTEYPNLIVSI